MTIQEKIACTHNASASEIHLWKEGIFWVAYEQSAYAVWLLKKYRPTKKFIKSADMEVVSIGFPQSAWDVVVGAPLVGAQFAPTDTHQIIPTPIPFGKEEFLAWKNSLPCRDVARNVSTTEPPPVLAQIKNFDLSNATPMECMNFLAKIKSKIES